MKYKGAVSPMFVKDCLSLFSLDIRVQFNLSGEKYWSFIVASGKTSVDYKFSKAVYQEQKMKLGVGGGKSGRAEAFKSHHISGRVIQARKSNSLYL